MHATARLLYCHHCKIFFESAATVSTKACKKNFAFAYNFLSLQTTNELKCKELRLAESAAARTLSCCEVLENLISKRKVIIESGVVITQDSVPVFWFLKKAQETYLIFYWRSIRKAWHFFFKINASVRTQIHFLASYDKSTRYEFNCLKAKNV